MTSPKKITAIQYRKKKKGSPELCDILLNGTLWAKLDPETVLREGLRTGIELDENRQRDILRADEVLKAKRAAAVRNAIKPRSKKQVSAFLTERGYRLPVRTEAIEKLEQNGTIDDRAVARRHLRKRLRQGGYGELRLKAELEAIGIDRKLIDDEVRVTLENADSAQICRDFAAKKLRQYEPISDPANRRRLIDVLRRRGFDMRTIQSTISALGSTEDDVEGTDEAE